jgi:hypothetical protein
MLSRLRTAASVLWYRTRALSRRHRRRPDAHILPSRPARSVASLLPYLAFSPKWSATVGAVWASGLYAAMAVEASASTAGATQAQLVFTLWQVQASLAVVALPLLIFAIELAHPQGASAAPSHEVVLRRSLAMPALLSALASTVVIGLGLASFAPDQIYRTLLAALAAQVGMTGYVYGQCMRLMLSPSRLRHAAVDVLRERMRYAVTAKASVHADNHRLLASLDDFGIEFNPFGLTLRTTSEIHVVRSTLGGVVTAIDLHILEQLSQYLQQHHVDRGVAGPILGLRDNSPTSRQDRPIAWMRQCGHDLKAGADGLLAVRLSQFVDLDLPTVSRLTHAAFRVAPGPAPTVATDLMFLRDGVLSAIHEGRAAQLEATLVAYSTLAREFAESVHATIPRRVGGRDLTGATFSLHRPWEAEFEWIVEDVRTFFDAALAHGQRDPIRRIFLVPQAVAVAALRVREPYSFRRLLQATGGLYALALRSTSAHLDTIGGLVADGIETLGSLFLAPDLRDAPSPAESEDVGTLLLTLVEHAATIQQLSLHRRTTADAIRVQRAVQAVFETLDVIPHDSATDTLHELAEARTQAKDACRKRRASAEVELAARALKLYEKGVFTADQTRAWLRMITVARSDVATLWHASSDAAKRGRTTLDVADEQDSDPVTTWTDLSVHAWLVFIVVTSWTLDDSRTPTDQTHTLDIDDAGTSLWTAVEKMRSDDDCDWQSLAEYRLDRVELLATRLQARLSAQRESIAIAAESAPLDTGRISRTGKNILIGWRDAAELRRLVDARRRIQVHQADTPLTRSLGVFYLEPRDVYSSASRDHNSQWGRQLGREIGNEENRRVVEALLTAKPRPVRSETDWIHAAKEASTELQRRGCQPVILLVNAAMPSLALRDHGDFEPSEHRSEKREIGALAGTRVYSLHQLGQGASAIAVDLRRAGRWRQGASPKHLAAESPLGEFFTFGVQELSVQRIQELLTTHPDFMRRVETEGEQATRAYLLRRVEFRLAESFSFEITDATALETVAIEDRDAS